MACWLPGLALAFAACAGPPPPPVRTVAAEPVGAAVEAPGAAYAREREEQKRGIGVPPALPAPGAIDRLPGTLRAAQPAPGTGPAAPPPPAAPSSRALSRLSAVPASPLANPPGGLVPARPW